MMNWPCDQELREVVRSHVRRRDRDEREDEVGDERAVDPTELLRRRDRREVGREDRRNEEGESPDVEERGREIHGPLRRAGELGAQLAEQVLPGTRATEAVEARRSEEHRDEEQRAANAVVTCEPGERPADDDRSVSHRERSDPREEPEGDGEALAVPRPRVAAVHRHPRERPVRVERDRDPERARISGPRMCELERDEREQGRRGRVPAPRPRPLEHGSRLSPSAFDRPHRRVGERAPRAQHAPHVSEQDRQERDPQPEDHVHERGREVEELDRRSEERRRERQTEQEHGERTEDDAHRSREDETREPGGQLSPARMRLEQRPAPEIEEKDERDGRGRPPRR